MRVGRGPEPIRPRGPYEAVPDSAHDFLTGPVGSVDDALGTRVPMLSGATTDYGACARCRDSYDDSPGSSILAAMLADAQEVIDAALWVPVVDADRIGAVGYGVSATVAALLPREDDRIVASVALSPPALTPDDIPFGGTEVNGLVLPPWFVRASFSLRDTIDPARVRIITPSYHDDLGPEAQADILQALAELGLPPSARES